MAGPPAEAVALLLQFVNTRADGAGRVEQFGSAAAFGDWARRHGLLDDDTVVLDSDVAAARELRDALVTVLLAHANDPHVDDARLQGAEHYLHQTGARYPLRAVVTADTTRLVPAGIGIPGALAAILAAVAHTAQDDQWSRVKACCNPPCHQGFIDRTRNQAGRYCSPGCGSQVSMRALRQRRSATHKLV